MNTLLPKHITILAEGLTLEGHFSDGNYSDATHGISVSWDDGLIQIVCANKDIKGIILQFPSPFAGGDFKLLNDHWERSYGDLQWSADYQHRNFPWYVIGTSKEHHIGVGVQTNPAALCAWTLTGQSLRLHCDIASGSHSLRLDGALDVAHVEIQTEEASHTELFDFCADFCATLATDCILPDHKVYGFNDWYYAYGRNSAEGLKQDAAFLAELTEGIENRPYFVIDDGWQVGTHQQCGPWDRGNHNYGDMKALADSFKDLDLRPGLWIRPLKTAEPIPEEWKLFEDRHGFVLDPSHPEVLNYIAETVQRITGEWGFELIKYDFSTYDVVNRWGNDVEPNRLSPRQPVRFHDPSKSTAQILRKLYEVIHENANGAIIIGCNVIGHLATGTVHLQRTGDDTSGTDWERTVQMGVNTLAMRLPQHNHFYAVDADCIGITKHVDWENNREWLRLLAESGTPTFMSIDRTCLTAQMITEIREAIATSATKTSLLHPKNWLENKFPDQWEEAGNLQTFDWQYDPATPDQSAFTKF